MQLKNKYKSQNAFVFVHEMVVTVARCLSTHTWFLKLTITGITMNFPIVKQYKLDTRLKNVIHSITIQTKWHTILKLTILPDSLLHIKLNIC